MITKIAPDSGEVLYNGYVQLPQLVCRPNTRQSEDVRRTYGAGTEDCLLAIDGKLLMTADYAQAYRPMASKMIPVTRQWGLMVNPFRLRAGSR